MTRNAESKLVQLIFISPLYSCHPNTNNSPTSISKDQKQGSRNVSALTKAFNSEGVIRPEQIMGFLNEKWNWKEMKEEKWRRRYDLLSCIDAVTHALLWNYWYKGQVKNSSLVIIHSALYFNFLFFKKTTTSHWENANNVFICPRYL